MRTPAAALLLAFLVSACGGPNSPDPPPPPPPPPPPNLIETLVGAGDIGWCGAEGGAPATAALIDGIPGTVFTTGDNAYFDGTLQDYIRCYEPAWGRFRDRTKPTPGNHEYHTPGAAGYFGYFGDAASPPEGYYSYRLGAWHIFALNSETSAFPGSAQYTWLRDALAANRTQCALAYFHTPVFGSGSNGSNPQMQAIWALLQDGGADVIVAGHNHSYERFAPQDSQGRPDPQRGIRQFVVGTGGAPLTGFGATRANSERRDNSAWGVLKLTLHPTRYEWQFVPVAGRSFTDSGGENCH